MCVCVCGWVKGGSRWLHGIGSGWSHVFGGQGCVCMCESVFTGMRVLACRYMLIHQKVLEGRVHSRLPLPENGKTEWSDWCIRKITIQIKWRLQIEHAWVRKKKQKKNTAVERWQITQCVIFLSASLAKSSLMVKCKKKDSQQKRNMISSTFFLLFILPSAHLTLNETPSDLRGRSFVSRLSF